MNSQILEKVEKSVVCGIKKAELKKLFGTDCETSLDELAKADKVIVDNKGVAHYVWSKDNYLSHVSQNDPKFKILSRLVTNLENKISQMQPVQIPQNIADFQIHFDRKFDSDDLLIKDQCLCDSILFQKFSPISDLFVCKRKSF